MRFFLIIASFAGMLMLAACITVEAQDAEEADVNDETTDVTTETDDAEASPDVDGIVDEDDDDTVRTDDEQADEGTVEVTTEPDDGADVLDDQDADDATNEDDDAVLAETDDADTTDVTTEDDEERTDTSTEPETTAGNDEAYISQMIEHHEVAIEMAEIALERAERAEILELAREIIDSHQAEISVLQDWLDDWYDGGTAESAATHDEMRSPHNFDDPDDSRPFDLVFIDEMMAHQEEVIDMAREIRKSTDREELRKLAENVISAQESEIDQLGEWRDSWYRK